MENKQGKESFGDGRVWKPIDDQGSDQRKKKPRPKSKYPRLKRAITP